MCSTSGGFVHTQTLSISVPDCMSWKNGISRGIISLKADVAHFCVKAHGACARDPASAVRHPPNQKTHNFRPHPLQTVSSYNLFTAARQVSTSLIIWGSLRGSPMHTYAPEAPTMPPLHHQSGRHITAKPIHKFATLHRYFSKRAAIENHTFLHRQGRGASNGE